MAKHRGLGRAQFGLTHWLLREGKLPYEIGRPKVWTAPMETICKVLAQHYPEQWESFHVVSKDGKRAAIVGMAKILIGTKREKRENRKLTAVAEDSFLHTYEWRRVRMQALKLHGARCQCCGASPATGAVMNVDHIKPRRVYPELALDVNNLQVLCDACNHGKGNWDMTDWRKQEEVHG